MGGCYGDLRQRECFDLKACVETFGLGSISKGVLTEVDHALSFPGLELGPLVIERANRDQVLVFYGNDRSGWQAENAVMVVGAILCVCHLECVCVCEAEL